MSNKIKDNCFYLENIFIDYINGNLSDEDTSFCSNHLKTCEKCKNNQELLEIKNTWKLMDKWEDVPVSNNFMAKLQREIVLLEEKQRIFWFNLDRIIALFRVPVTALFIFVFSLSNSMSYAKPEKRIFIQNSMQIEQSIKNYSQKNIADVIKDIKSVIHNERRN